MTSSAAEFRDWADQIDRGADVSTRQLEQRLEAALAPMVRTALTRGVGLPQLVRWVKNALPRVAPEGAADRPVDPNQAAAPLARLLCAALLRPRSDARPPSARETVVGV
jgi:hypothetical protein